MSDGGGQPDAGDRPLLLPSIYFREPSGVLFEIATIGPGFTTDEPLETLGRRTLAAADYEQYREQVERILTPPAGPAT